MKRIQTIITTCLLTLSLITGSQVSADNQDLANGIVLADDKKIYSAESLKVGLFK